MTLLKTSLFVYKLPCLSFYSPACPSERERADAAAPRGLLPQGRLPADPAAREAHVRHQLHGDGARHGSPAHLPTRQGAADQGHLAAAQDGAYSARVM